MRSVVIFALVSCATACGKKDSAPAAGSGSAAVPPPVVQTPPPPPAPPDAAAATDDGAGEVAQLVVASVASPALGKQTIEASCVSVAVIPAGDWTVAAARLKDCGDKTARSIMWLFKRPQNGKWSEDFAGQPPKCWKGVPPDIAGAVAKASKIPTC